MNNQIQFCMAAFRREISMSEHDQGFTSNQATMSKQQRTCTLGSPPCSDINIHVWTLASIMNSLNSSCPKMCEHYKEHVLSYLAHVQTCVLHVRTLVAVLASWRFFHFLHHRPKYNNYPCPNKHKNMFWTSNQPTKT